MSKMNIAIAKAIKKLGSQKNLGTYLGVKQGKISEWKLLKTIPSAENLGQEMLEEIEAKFYILMGQSFKESFPSDQQKEFEEGFVSITGQNKSLIVCKEENEIDHVELKKAIEETLAFLAKRNSLNYRTVEILKLRSSGYSLEEIATIFKVSRERIRQIEAKALYVIRHSIYMKQLAEFSD